MSSVLSALTTPRPLPLPPLPPRTTPRVGLGPCRVGPGTRCSLFRGVPGSGSGVLRGGFRGHPGLFRVHQSPSKQPLPNTPTPSPNSYQPLRHGVWREAACCTSCGLSISAWICDGGRSDGSTGEIGRSRCNSASTCNGGWEPQSGLVLTARLRVLWFK
jgi:hypothetical protein